MVMIMPAVSFSTMKDKILNGEKKQTIRPKRSDYWSRWQKGDRLVGYWKLRSRGESEKLFDSQFAEDPFVVSSTDFNQELALKDGFRDNEYFKAVDHMKSWFVNKYTDEFIEGMEFFVLRWK